MDNRELIATAVVSMIEQKDAELTRLRADLAAAEQARDEYRGIASELVNALVGEGRAGMSNEKRLMKGVWDHDRLERASTALMAKHHPKEYVFAEDFAEMRQRAEQAEQEAEGLRANSQYGVQLLEQAEQREARLRAALEAVLADADLEDEYNERDSDGRFIGKPALLHARAALAEGQDG